MNIFQYSISVESDLNIMLESQFKPYSVSLLELCCFINFKVSVSCYEKFGPSPFWTCHHSERKQ